MRSFLVITGIFFGIQMGIAQSHFENIFASTTTTYSGVADGGMSRGFSYTYIAHTDLTLTHVYFQGEVLVLTKGDSVIFNGSTYQPYQPDTELFKDSTVVVDTTIQQKFYARKANGIYYVGIPYDSSWEYARKYLIGDKSYTADYKKEFDQQRSYAMP